VFYSISNCQRGLAGVSFGNFLIKQVVEEIARENPKLSKFVTLSPVPNFAQWLKREREAEAPKALTPEDKAALVHLDTPQWWQDEVACEAVEEPLLRAAAWYFMHGRTRNGNLIDAVARFHLGNGARLERLNWLGDPSERALSQAYGLMVNYLYDLDHIEKNHEAFAQHRTVVASKAVTSLVRKPAREVVPAAGSVSASFF
jgi:malonyl-CoA decarboxylase